MSRIVYALKKTQLLKLKFQTLNSSSSYYSTYLLVTLDLIAFIAPLSYILQRGYVYSIMIHNIK